MTIQDSGLHSSDSVTFSAEVIKICGENSHPDAIPQCNATPVGMGLEVCQPGACRGLHGTLNAVPDKLI